MNGSTRHGRRRPDAPHRLEPDDVVSMLTPILSRLETAQAGPIPYPDEPALLSEPAPAPLTTPSPTREPEPEHEDSGPHHGCRMGRYFAGE